MAPPLIELAGATKRFPSGSGSVHTAVRDLDLTVGEGEFVAVVGPTGCGKSTTLSLVSGLQPASAGVVRVNGTDVRSIPDGVGYMFQTDAVMPWRSVLDNVASGPRFRGARKADARAQAADWIERVGLKGFEKYYPHQLSGGMRKRVALAQTLVTSPRILLMDEPFSALDVQTRALMQDELLRLWAGSDAAVIFVTHDLDEAIALADKVVVMTASPATVKDVFEVPLPRPRAVEELRLTEEFMGLYRQVWESLRTEVDKARERGAGNVA
ncbi:ABC transporter ATP-binding protein [Amycolatopsis sp. CA-230715]|uniref:ABC transporter ATP-binding protein n=1 Tax=Amycolatopsis sp. CA-230715 TaxID=2745196 RepID=UPI001C020126|nr:ABC transporter ATP-binding protein [Amycolatopsis sp. CA-230715]QWF80110.1 Aliphatic sulfonates import ATP-binding protein SsuB [Amycolatopsis sp. CA-230715]